MLVVVESCTFSNLLKHFYFFFYFGNGLCKRRGGGGGEKKKPPAQLGSTAVSKVILWISWRHARKDTTRSSIPISSTQLMFIARARTRPFALSEFECERAREVFKKFCANSRRRTEPKIYWCRHRYGRRRRERDREK